MSSLNPENKFKISKKIIAKDKRKSPPKRDDPVAFGALPTDHMLVCDYLSNKGGWQSAEIRPFEPFSMRPDAVALHYGQTIFEGIKAFRSAKNSDEVFVFRPEMNAKRMIKSAIRMAMEPFPESYFLQCVKELVRVEKNWVLPQPFSLYIRPAMIALDEGVSYRPSKNYRFFIILSPAKAYFSKEESISVMIERELSRSCPGGSGEAKCGGNYASALPPMIKAKQLGAEQVLWLDAAEHKYIEEAGAMNVMFISGKKLMTPSLTGSILHGVTRDSILILAKDLGFEICERRIEVNEVIQQIKSKQILEAFACGTAAVITPIQYIFDKEEKIEIGDNSQRKISLQLKEALLNIQSGLVEDKYNWLLKI